ncbi:MAG TPA: YARHG domain-containing protein [Armatimonadetes bacterium]|nr:YARHG domain-containing protein [Armatimonadota bacterium]
MEEHPSVRMVAEDVHIKLATGEVVCQFVFKNEGPATTVLMGFPEGGGGDVRVPEYTNFDRFEARVDGVKVPVRRVVPKDQGPAEYQIWWVKRVHFRRGQRRVVRNRYTSSLGSNIAGYSFFEYILRTGASWKGKIGEARIVVDLTGLENYSNFSISPQGYRRNGSRIAWQFRDFEPQEDISISFFPGYLDIEVNGQRVKWESKIWGMPPPQRVGSEVHLPVRVAARWLQATVNYEKETGTAVLERNGWQVAVRPGCPFAVGLIGQVRFRRVPWSQRFGGQYYLMASLRPLVEALGGHYRFEATTGKTLVEFKEVPPVEDLPPFLWRELSEADLVGRPRDELRLMRNEIYARHGLRFRSKELQAYFEQQPWYKTCEGFSGCWLPPLQQHNVSLLLAQEQKLSGEAGS